MRSRGTWHGFWLLKPTRFNRFSETRPMWRFRLIYDTQFLLKNFLRLGPRGLESQLGRYIFILGCRFKKRKGKKKKDWRFANRLFATRTRVTSITPAIHWHAIHNWLFWSREASKASYLLKRAWLELKCAIFWCFLPRFPYSLRVILLCRHAELISLQYIRIYRWKGGPLEANY